MLRQKTRRIRAIQFEISTIRLETRSCPRRTFRAIRVAFYPREKRRNYSLFILKRGMYIRGEKPPRKRFFISIDRRSRGVGEIVYLARPRYSPREYSWIPAWVYRRHNLPRLRRSIRGLRRTTTVIHQDLFHQYFCVYHFASDFAIRSASYLVSRVASTRLSLSWLRASFVQW